MPNAIESGRQAIEYSKQIEKSCREIFLTSIWILRQKGEPVKQLAFFKYQVFNHAANSSNPPVSVRISAGANLDKARIVTIKIEEVASLKVIKRAVKGQEKFKGIQYYSDIIYGSALRPDSLGVWDAASYLNAIRQVKTEIASH